MMEKAVTMRVRKNLLIFADKYGDNEGLKYLVEKLEREYADFQAIVLTEDEYGGLKKAKTRYKLVKLFTQKFPQLARKIDIINRKSKKPFKLKGLIADKLPSEYKCFYNAIVRFLPEIVLATSPKTLAYALDARRKGSLNCKIVSFCKNFTLDKNYYDYRADGYIVENGCVRDELIELGVRPENISVLGLPFEEKKYIIKEIVAAKEKIGINFNTTVLLYGGKLGCGNMLDVFKLLLDQGDTLNILAYCGKNNDLYDRLNRIVLSEKVNNVKLYVDGANVGDLLTSADVCVSHYDTSFLYKAFLRALPVVVYSPLSKAEENDFSYLENQNLAYYAKDANEVIIDVYKIVQENLGANLKQSEKKLINANSLKEICNYLTISNAN